MTGLPNAEIFYLLQFPLDVSYSYVYGHIVHTYLVHISSSSNSTEVGFISTILDLKLPGFRIRIRMFLTGSDPDPGQKGKERNE